MDLPKDIVDEVYKKFPKSNTEEALIIFESIKKESLNVGNDQLIRSLILLSEGNLDVIKSIRDARYWGDPRDVLSVANAKFPNYNFGLNEF